MLNSSIAAAVNPKDDEQRKYSLAPITVTASSRR